jgi:hypothetical protein
MATGITNLDITVGTGEDNLREDSSATAWILVIEGKETKEYSTVIKTETDPEWTNHSTHGPIGWNVPPGINNENISRFGIRMQSHESVTETSDNWNINTVQVTYPDGGGGNAVLVDQAGGPLVRLTGSEPAWETVLS